MVFDRAKQVAVDTFVGTDNRVLALAFARMTDSFGNSFLIVVLPLYVADGPVEIDPLIGVRVPVLGVTATEAILIGVLLSLFGFLNSFGQPATGRASDRTGRRKAFILFGLVLLGGASAAYPAVADYGSLLALRALQGIGAAFTIPATVALVNELGAAETRGGNFGVFNTFRLVGFGFGPVVAGALVELGPYSLPAVGTITGFEAAFYGAAAGAFAGFALVAALVSDPERTRASAADDLAIAILDPERRRLLDPVFAVGVSTLFMAISLGLFATLENIVNARLDQGSTLFAAEFAAAVVANVAFQTPIGRLSDEYGRRPFLLAGFVILAPSTLVQGVVTTPGAMIVARFVQGIAIAFVFTPGLALAGDLAREGASGTQLSVLTMAFGLGVAIGPLASGFLVGYGFVYPFAFGAALGVAGLALVYTQVDETVADAASVFGVAARQD